MPNSNSARASRLGPLSHTRACTQCHQLHLYSCFHMLAAPCPSSPPDCKYQISTRHILLKGFSQRARHISQGNVAATRAGRQLQRRMLPSSSPAAKALALLQELEQVQVCVVARLAAVHQRPCNTQRHARMQAPAMKCSAMVAVTCVPLQCMACGQRGGGWYL